MLSEKLCIPFFDLDEKITEQDGRQVNEIFQMDGEEYFRFLEKDVMHLLTESHETFVMATGGGTPCFYNNIDYLKKQGVVVWLNCSTGNILERLVKEKSKRPLISHIPDKELKSYIIKKYSSRKIFYQQANVILPEETITLESLVNSIFQSSN